MSVQLEDGSKRPTNVGRTDGILRARQLRRLQGGSLGYCNTLIELVGWNYNAILTGVSFRVRNDIWSAVIKADFLEGPLVSFLDVGSFARCVEVLNEYAEKRLLVWHPDKYPPKTRKLRRFP